MTNSSKEFTDGLSSCRTEPNPSSTGNSSPSRSEKSLRQTLKQTLKGNMSRLETKIKESHSNALGMCYLPK